MEKKKVFKSIIDKLSKLDIEFIYIFGSYGLNQEREDSDIDIAFYSYKEYDSFEIFLLAQEVSKVVKREVDLIQLKNSSTVFQKEVIEHGKVIYEKSLLSREKFEILVLKKYSRLNEERRQIIENYEV